MAAKKYFNRELSWLEFNHRVLEEARDTSVPLLERLKFLAITSSNLDEFFMVRVGGLQTLVAQGVSKREPSGMTPERQLAAVSRRVHRMADEQNACFMNELEPGLRAAGLVRKTVDDLTELQRAALAETFERDIFPVLTPMAVDPTKEFPLVTNRMLHLGVRLRGVEATASKPRFALIPLGMSLGRFVALPSDTGFHYILLEDVVAQCTGLIFPGEDVMECVPFRVTRNADMSVQEDMAADLLEEMEEVLDERKRSHCVRLEVAEAATETMLGFLQPGLGVRDDDIYAAPGPINFSDFMSLGGRQGFESHQYPSWTPQASPAVEPGKSMFETLAKQDLLFVHPFESFDPVVRFVEEAADDPDVLAIKQILYRTSRNSPVVAALMRAAQKGKYVTVVVELKARFDEARNIEWAKALQEEGVQVIYGVKGLKTHAKLCLVVRKEQDGVQRYMHFGTGNYNESTAKMYTDVSYMTRNPEYAFDATAFFNAVTGYSQPHTYRKLAAAPHGLRDKVLAMIDSEIERRKQGQKARIMAKMNSLQDPAIIKALYKASNAGVKIRLNVRGICSLRPGVPKLSENIEVVSIVDRFLEHSRVFYFHHGGDEQVFISSADWMPRNLDKRIELMTPVEDPRSRDRLVAMLEACFEDRVKGRVLKPHGGYEARRKVGGRKPLRSQDELCTRARRDARQAETRRRTVFEPHRPAGAES